MFLLIWTEYSGEQYGPLGPLLLLIFVIGLSEPRAQVRFFDRYSSIVRRILWNKLFIFLSSPKTTKPISTKLGTKHPELMGIQICSNERLPRFSSGMGLKTILITCILFIILLKSVKLLVNISQMSDVAHDPLVRFRKWKYFKQRQLCEFLE